MKPLRPVVDEKALEFVQSQTFTRENFTINKFSDCRLNPQLARAVANQFATMSSLGAVHELLGRLL
jgi:hypothetical protein